MAVPETITKLIERFDFHRQSHISSRDVYNETKLRQDYLDHVFIALGWDVYNTQGWSEQAREVSLEQPIKILGTTDFIDYSFKIGKDLKFIAEAKAPRVRIKDNTNAAYQVRRYAWNATLSLCLLTNFDEFAVYDCTKRPSSSDAPSVARIEYFTYKDLPAKWDWIVSVFSKDAVFKGSFDRFAESTKSKKGTASVDDDILTEIENWRDALAKNIALRNTSLSVEELNYSVQTIIDRIIFLRICEDRGLEPKETLKVLLDTDDVYLHLCDLFRRADTKYNSGIFYFQKEPDREEPDTLTLSLKVDDKVIKGIIRRLYYPESPYEFSVIPTAILGHVYEQFLGKIIRLTEGHQAKVEYKPEVKKAGGVFYTPQYIVEYIVRHTVEELVKGKTPREVSQIRILDPACGSGSFLLGAYQSLLDWHLEWYIQNLASLLNLKFPVTDAKVQALLPEPIQKKKKSAMPVELPIYPTGYSNGIKKLDRTRSDWALSTTEKKRILLNNIYGVDIDHQAVEVTKLSLLLKVLEGENEQNIDKQLKICDERALPSLHQNIKCGNSLIGTDILTPEMPPDEVKRINPFDWEREFADIMKAGGFDAVIGNPPYIRIQTMKEWAPQEVEFYKKKFISASKGNYDIYVVFVEKGMSLLNKNGVLGYILPHKFFTAQYGESLRSLVAKGEHLNEVVHFGHQQIFAGATTYTCLLFLRKTKNSSFHFVKVDDIETWKNTGSSVEGEISSKDIGSSDWNLVVGSGHLLFEKMKSLDFILKKISHTFVGTQTSAEDIFVLQNCKIVNNLVVGYSKADGREVSIEKDIIKWFLKGRHIRRYEPLATDFALLCPYEINENDFRLFTKDEIVIRFPLAFEYLTRHKKFLVSREKGKFEGKDWWAFGYPKSMILFQKPKIICPFYHITSAYAFDTNGYFFKTGYGILLKDTDLSYHYILGLLNSRLLFWYYQRICTVMREGYSHYMTQYIEQLPIRTIDFSDSTEKARHDRMVALVTQMLELNKKLQDARLEQEKTALSRQVEATDASIDKLVYELYGLTEEEIAIVEGEGK